MGTMSVFDSLVDENIGLLRSGLRVITSIPADIYREGHDRVTDGGVGRHFRHILEFYTQLLERDGTVVDYESRRRDPRVESDPDYASSVVARIIDSLEALCGPQADADLDVVSEVLDAEGRPIPTASSLRRELAVLASHTIHHYAIIALLLRGSGVELPEHFGVAPSTLRFMASRSS